MGCALALHRCITIYIVLQQLFFPPVSQGLWDAGYERRRVREAQEAEDRKGAANAVTHTDFLYT